MFFPGGSIGDLAVNGTVNDLAMSGATPLFLSTAFILAGGHRAGRHRPGRRGDGRGGASAPACGWSPATPRSSTAAAATASTSTPPASAWSPDGVDIGPRRAAVGDVVHRQRRHRRARRRGDELPRGPGVRHHGRAATPRRCTGWSRTCSPPAPTCTCCATRPAAACRVAQRDRPGLRGRRRAGRAGPADPADGARRVRPARARPAPGRQRGQAARVRARRSRPTRCWRRCGHTRSGPAPGAIGTCVRRAPRHGGGPDRRSAAPGWSTCRSASSCPGSAERERAGSACCSRGTPTRRTSSATAARRRRGAAAPGRGRRDRPAGPAVRGRLGLPGAHRRAAGIADPLSTSGGRGVLGRQRPARRGRRRRRWWRICEDRFRGQLGGTWRDAAEPRGRPPQLPGVRGVPVGRLLLAREATGAGRVGARPVPHPGRRGRRGRRRGGRRGVPAAPAGTATGSPRATRSPSARAGRWAASR